MILTDDIVVCGLKLALNRLALGTNMLVNIDVVLKQNIIVSLSYCIKVYIYNKTLPIGGCC